jgi:hypothetical protein
VRAIARPLPAAAATLLLVSSSGAQSLELPSVDVQRGSAQVLRIGLKAAAEHPLASVQWELLYPAGLTIVPADAVTGSGPESQGKSLVCASRPPRGAERVLVCILAGGVEPLRGGQLALIRFVAGATASKGSLVVHLEHALGVSASLDSVPLPAVRSTVMIQ